MADASSLPIRTTVDDVTTVVAYLASKPMGAALADAKRVLDAGVLDGRKISAMRFWGLVEENEGKLKVTDRGRTAAKDKGAHLHVALQQVIRSIPAYFAIVERAAHRQEYIVTAVDVATHWHEHFKAVSSSNETILNHQAVCFFQLAAGAHLGMLVVGRKGSPTRVEFAEDKVAALAGLGEAVGASNPDEVMDEEHGVAEDEVVAPDPAAEKKSAKLVNNVTNNKVFITHGKNLKVLEQIKEIVAYGNYVPVVAKERESAAKPVPDKVMDDMRECAAAVIHVSSEGSYKNAKGEEVPRINENVLIEIGAAMALYRRNFILVVEEGLTLPSNLQGLYECRYAGDELGMPATMKLLKAFKDFRELGY
jgi:predicted nucleotide-binding protein